MYASENDSSERSKGIKSFKSTADLAVNGAPPAVQVELEPQGKEIAECNYSSI
jgi:hypothetical protein